MSAEMDATQWTAVLEMCDEIASRVPEPEPAEFTSKLNELRSIAVAERAFALLGTGLVTPSGEVA